MKNGIALIAILTSISLPCVSHASSSGAGTSTAHFLKLGLGARGSAMGEAQAALVDDVTASYWNPAGLSNVHFQELSLMHYSLEEGIRYQQAGYAYPTENRGVFAVGLNILDYGSIQGYGTNSAPTGQVDASQKLISGSWGKRFSDKLPLSAGVSLKYLNSELAGYKASAPMMDAGLQYAFEAGRYRGLRLAANIRNMGPDVKFDRENSPLPRMTVVGAGFSAFGGNLQLEADAITPRSESTYFTTGAEYRVFDILRLRVGYNGISNFVGNGIAFGMGLRFTQWNVDYAYVPFGDLGNTNRISVGIRFGRAVQLRSADMQVENTYRLAEAQLALGKGVEAYNTVNELLTIAPWHKPSVALKAKIQKQFDEMSASKDKARMEADIATYFTDAKAAFDRDELVAATKGFQAILALQPEHVGSKVYLERIQNRYASLAHESFKQGMDYYAAGDYANAKVAFEKTLTIDPSHADAKAQLQSTVQLMADAKLREEEMNRLAGAGDAYKTGLALYQKNDLEGALAKFEEVKKLMPEYEEVSRYIDLTKVTLAGVLYEESQVNVGNGQLEQAVAKLKRAAELQPADSKIATGLNIAQRDLDIKNAEESRNLYKQGLEAYLGGQTTKAESLWRRSLELDATNDDALKAIAKLEEQKKYEKAKE